MDWMPYMSEPDAPKKQKVPFITSTIETCEEVVKFLNIKPTETLIDLGCGDGRILFKAHELTGCPCVGVDINENLIEECNKKAKEEGISNSMTFKVDDIFREDFNFYRCECLCFYLVPKVIKLLKAKVMKYLQEDNTRRCVLIRFPFKDIIPTKIDEEYKLYYYDYQSIEGKFGDDSNNGVYPAF